MPQIMPVEISDSCPDASLPQCLMQSDPFDGDDPTIDGSWKRSQRSDSFLGQRYCPCCPVLGYRQMRSLGFEIDVRPLKFGQFAASHARLQAQDSRRKQPHVDSTCRDKFCKKPRFFIRREYAIPTLGRRRLADQCDGIGDVDVPLPACMVDDG